jgi:hypothetical protein
MDGPHAGKWSVPAGNAMGNVTGKATDKAIDKERTKMTPAFRGGHHPPAAWGRTRPGR